MPVALGELAERTTVDSFARFLQGVAVAIERGTPLADVLRAQAVDVREAVTTCLLLRSYREVVVGDRVELRAGGAQTAGITR